MPAAKSVPLSLAGFNVDAAVGRMFGCRELWWETVELFFAHHANWEGEWLASRGDDALERKKVHAIRSAAANVGAERLACAAAVLDDLLTMRLAGRPVGIPASVRWYLQDCFGEAWRAVAAVRLQHSLAGGSAT